jgi:hypothetical protein
VALYICGATRQKWAFLCCKFGALISRIWPLLTCYFSPLDGGRIGFPAIRKVTGRLLRDEIEQKYTLLELILLFGWWNLLPGAGYIAF